MMLSRHSRLIWLGVMVLSPLAYIGSLLVERALPGHAAVTVIDEAQALRIGRQFAASRHLDVQGWNSSVASSNDEDLEAIYHEAHPAALEQIAVPVKLRLEFQPPDGRTSLRVNLAPDGRILSFQYTAPKDLPPADAETARASAENFLHTWLGAQSVLPLEYRKGSDTDDDHQGRTFTWQALIPGMPKTTATFRVDVNGDQVIAIRPSLTLNKAQLRRLRPQSSLISTWKAFSGIYMFVFGVIAIVRYIRRAGDKEVSHQRTALATLVWVGLSALIFYDPGYLSNIVSEPTLGRERWILQFSIAAGMVLMGAFFGVAYGAGEGGLRESYPGKLTSLDALMSGKLFSANVARSVLRGGAIAGWLLLFQNLILLGMQSFRAGAAQDVIGSSFLKLPLAALILDRFTDAVVHTTFGLLLPIVLFRPRIQKRWLYFGLLGLCAFLSAGMTGGGQSSWIPFLAMEGAMLGALYIPFASGDLLAGMCSFFALRFVGGLIERSAISTEWQHIFLWEVGPAGVLFLAAQVAAAWRGREYDEAEVRPKYARYLAEHISMEAEVGAARLAQLRLLPGAPPIVTGLSIAGSCVPAREVGGDFYDFYPLDASRVGVFLAEGGSRELGSAMTIALAKGYLLYSSGLDLSPAEILRRLLDAMPAALHGSGNMSVLYAVIDSRARTIRFARTGTSPRLLINGMPAAEELAADAAKRVRHGVASLTPRDMLVFFTDGLATQIAERKRQWTEKFVQKLLKSHPQWTAAELHAALLKAAIRGKQQPPDDITSVVIRIDEPNLRQMEVVA